MLDYLWLVVLGFAGQLATASGDVRVHIRARLGCAPSAPCAADAPTPLLTAALEAIDAAPGAAEAPFEAWYLAYLAHRALPAPSAQAASAQALTLDACGDPAAALLAAESLVKTRPQQAALIRSTLGQRHGWTLADSGLTMQALQRVGTPEAACSFARAVAQAEALEALRQGPLTPEALVDPETPLLRRFSCTARPKADLADLQVTVVAVAADVSIDELEETHLLIKTRTDALRVLPELITVSNSDNSAEHVELKSISLERCGDALELWVHTAGWDGLNCAGHESIDVLEAQWRPWVAAGLVEAPGSDTLAVEFAYRMPRVDHSVTRFALDGRRLGEARFVIEGPPEVTLMEAPGGPKPGVDRKRYAAALADLYAAVGVDDDHDPEGIRALFDDPVARRRAVCADRALSPDD